MSERSGVCAVPGRGCTGPGQELAVAQPFAGSDDGTGLASPRGVYVHTLEFVDRDHLASAFERIISSEYVENCLVETERMRIRFLAEASHAEPLVERIYLDGGLRFASRHGALTLLG